MKHQAYCLISKGKRDKQEDNYVFNNKNLSESIIKNFKEDAILYSTFDLSKKLEFFAISDGIGGHHAGHVASQICTSELRKLEKRIENLGNLKEIVNLTQETINLINQKVVYESKKDPILKGMGCTLVLLIKFENKYLFFSLGDSRAYFFTGDELIQLTNDNNEGQRMIDLGLLSRSELENFPDRDRLTRYIGYDKTGFILKADENFYILDSGLIIICSDGIYNYIKESKIVSILSQNMNLLNKGLEIISNCVRKARSDNATLMLIPVERS